MPVELVCALVPLDLVEPLPLQVVVAVEPRVVADADDVGDVQLSKEKSNFKKYFVEKDDVFLPAGCRQSWRLRRANRFGSRKAMEGGRGKSKDRLLYL